MQRKKDIVAKSLRMLRAEKGVSQKQVSKQTGMHAQTLCGYERGYVEPPVSAAVALANYYGVTVEDLIKE